MAEEADTNKAKPSAMDGPLHTNEAAPTETAKPKKRTLATYRALTDGFLSAESQYVKAGEVFSTDAPKGAWMEEVSAKEAKAANAE